jgi:hypothetical protein
VDGEVGGTFGEGCLEVEEGSVFEWILCFCKISYSKYVNILDYSGNACKREVPDSILLRKPRFGTKHFKSMAHGYAVLSKGPGRRILCDLT